MLNDVKGNLAPAPSITPRRQSSVNLGTIRK